jgi:hypothetical protein
VDEDEHALMARRRVVVRPEDWSDGDEGEGEGEGEGDDSADGYLDDLTMGEVQLNFRVPSPPDLASTTTTTTITTTTTTTTNAISVRVYKLATAVVETGGELWVGGLLLAAWLAHHPSVVRGKRCLALGAGLGVGGLVCGRLGAKHTTLTDYVPALLHNLRRAVRANRLDHSVAVRSLDWEVVAVETESGNLAMRAEVICGSELVYDEGHAIILTSVLARLLGPVGETEGEQKGRVPRVGHVFLVQRAGRLGWTAFVAAAQRQGLTVTLWPLDPTVIATAHQALRESGGRTPVEHEEHLLCHIHWAGGGGPGAHCLACENGQATCL